MIDTLFRVKDVHKFVNTKSKFIITVDSTEEWEVFPCFLQFGNGKHTLTVDSNGTGLVIFTDKPDEGDPIVMDPILSVFCFVDNTFTIKTAGKATVDARMVDEFGNNVVDGIEKASCSTMMANSTKKFSVKSNRIALKVCVHAPSQLSLDILGESNGKTHSTVGEISLSHKGDWCDVYFYPHAEGRFLASEGKKIGFFKYESEKPYIIALTFVVDGEGALIKGTIAGTSGTKILRQDGRIGINTVSDLSVRESGMTIGGNGYYDIEMFDQSI